MRIKVPCAIVPLNPNELRRPGQDDTCVYNTSPTGITNVEDCAVEDRCTFNLLFARLIIISSENNHYD